MASKAEKKNTAGQIVLLIVGIIAYIATYIIQTKLAREGNNSLNGIFAQIQVIISTFLVVVARKKGFIAGFMLNFLSMLSVLIFQVAIAGNTQAITGPIVTTCTIITITIIYVFSSRITKMHDELTESYEKLIETNRVIQEKDEKLTYLAYYDVLTNMPNRQLFIDKLDENIRNNTICTVVYTDIDDFKRINDSYGHNTGDIILCAYADRLRSFCGEANFVGRIGGDEFGIIIPGNLTEQAVCEYIEKIRAIIAEPVSANGSMFRTTMSYGIASYPQDGRTSEEIFKCTDIAVFNAKANGKDRPCFFSQQQQYIRR